MSVSSVGSPFGSPSSCRAQVSTPLSCRAQELSPSKSHGLRVSPLAASALLSASGLLKNKTPAASPISPTRIVLGTPMSGSSSGSSAVEKTLQVVSELPLQSPEARPYQPGSPFQSLLDLYRPNQGRKRSRQEGSSEAVSTADDAAKRSRAEGDSGTTTTTTTASTTTATKTSNRSLFQDPALLIAPNNPEITHLSHDEFSLLEKFYMENANILTKTNHREQVTLKYYNRKNLNNLPRSILFSTAEGNDGGLWVLLKEKGGAPEVGRGAARRVTLAYNMRTGCFKAAASFRQGDSLKEELEVLELFGSQKLCDFLLTGAVVHYEGLWRSRAFKRDGDVITPLVSKEDRRVYRKTILLMDLCLEGDLHVRLNAKARSPLTELQKYKMAVNVIKGLQRMHAEGWMHCDVKELNINFMNSDFARLGDFGIVSRIGKKHSGGTFTHMAPELMRNYKLRSENTDASVSKLSPENRKLREETLIAQFEEITEKADVWALGVVLLRAFKASGQVPVTPGRHLGEKTEDALNKIKAYRLPCKADQNHVHYWIDRCLQINPKNRPSMDELLPQFEAFVST